MIEIREIPRAINLEWHTDTLRFTVLEPFSVLVFLKPKLLGGASKVVRYTVPVGFDTDLASIPRAFLSITGGKIGKHLIAAVIHDKLYRTGEVPRNVADAIFLAAMEALGVSWVRRQVLYQAVRAGGASSYRPA